MKILNVILFLQVFLLASCSSYVDRVHRQMDRDYMRQQGIDPSRQGPPSAQLLRQHSRENQAPSTQSSNFHPPQVQRNYQSATPNRQVATSSHQRTRAEDLRDNQPSSSLWSGSENQLFSLDRTYGPGDIVLINVMDRLKGEISLELRRAFPERRPQPKDEEARPEAPEADRNVAAEQGDGQVHDRISSVIIEQVSRDHVLIRGRKNVLYRNAQRLVEVQALVSKRDISDNDTINSVDIIESQVSVLR